MLHHHRILLVALAVEVGMGRFTSETPVPEVVVEDFAAHCDKAPPADFAVLVQEAAAEFKVDPRMLAVTVYRESDCDPAARGASGEIGLAQVHPRVWTKTLVDEGLIEDAEDLWDPGTNLRASAFILARMSKAARGDVQESFRRYNLSLIHISEPTRPY